MELNRSEFEALFKNNYNSLCQTALRIIGDTTIAEDVVQDVFCKLWEKQVQLKIETSLKAYLHKAVINQALNHHKKEQALLKRDDIYALETYHQNNPTEQMLFAKDTKNKIDLIVNSMPEGCRRIFILNRFEKQSYKEIANTLNISIKTVENQMAKALKILRSHLLSILFLIFSTLP
jgi:RNA polymerase sigma-70 factor (ECF subfamily)